MLENESMVRKTMCSLPLCGRVKRERGSPPWYTQFFYGRMKHKPGSPPSPTQFLIIPGPLSQLFSQPKLR